MSSYNFPVILSFDVGVIHLAYCLLTKKEYKKEDGTSYFDWVILDWNNIDLTNRDTMNCHCGAKASLSNIINDEIKYYCKKHGKKIVTEEKPFEECFTKCDNINMCSYMGKIDKACTKKATLNRMSDNMILCNTHAKQIYKSENNVNKMKSFKIKDSRTLNFDDVKYTLIMELEKRKNLLDADFVVIENQPSFKNPRMKSIACTLYDYYLIRGIIDKDTTKSKIEQVKFMSPSNKLKLADSGDTKQLIKAKNDEKDTNSTKSYKLTKSLGIKYCLDLTKHLPTWQTHFNSHKKKDDLADAFLQGAYYYSTNIEPKPKVLPKERKKKEEESDITKDTLPKEEEKKEEASDTTKEHKRKPNKKSPIIIV